MTRDDYIRLCRNQAINNNKTVIFQNDKYKPIGFRMTFDKNGRTINSAIIRDLNSNCELIVEVEFLKGADEN